MRLITLVTLLSLPLCVHAQSSVWNKTNATKNNLSKKAENTGQKIKNLKKHLQEWGLDSSYKHAFLVGGKLNTDGWSGSMYFVKRKRNRDNRIWQISFSEVKHEKQVKQQGTNKSYPELGNPTPYVFGKINNLYTLQVGYGHETMLLPGVMEGNISVSMRYTGGLSLALLKPYYLKLMDIDYTTTPETAKVKEARYSSADSALFLNPNRILGAVDWSKRLDMIDYVPGAYFEATVVITPGKSKTFVQCITLGCNASIYYKTLPTMQAQQAYPWEVCLFAGLAIGKRW